MVLFDIEGTDEVYNALRGKLNPWCDEARSFIQELWRDVESYLDPDLPSKLPHEFHQRFWEIYLAASMVRAGIQLLPRPGRHVDAGPDICFIGKSGKKVWIEAVTAFAGAGPDTVQEGRLGVARDVPDDQIKLRLLNAFDNKYRKYKEYMENDIISSEEPYVIAINAARVPSAMLERELPRIVRALLPFGHEVIHLDRQSLGVVGFSHEYKDTVEKISGARISTAPFLDLAYSGISAVLYSCVDVFNHPAAPGTDLLLLRNPIARNPLEAGFLGRGYEYWVEDMILKNKSWNAVVTEQ
jgi:hypothetical protein